MKARSRLSPDERRAQLLELGIRHFTERSYEDFSMEELAAVAGVSKALVYHYFPTKREFYMEALRSAVAEMLELTEPPPGLEGQAALEAGLDAYLAYVEEHAAAYRAVLRGGIGADPEVNAIADGFRQAIYERILARMGAAGPAPAMRITVRGWVGFVEAASLDWLEHRDVARQELVDLLSAALARLLAEPEDAEQGRRRR